MWYLPRGSPSNKLKQNKKIQTGGNFNSIIIHINNSSRLRLVTKHYYGTISNTGIPGVWIWTLSDLVVFLIYLSSKKD